MKKKLNWVDILALAVILLLVAGTVIKFAVLDPNSRKDEEVTLQYQLKITGVRDYTVDALRVGDQLYGDTGKGEVGEITDIRVEEATSSVTFPDGTADLVPVEDRYDLWLTVTAQGSRDTGDHTIGEYRVGEYQMLMYQTSLYYTKYAAVYGQLVEIGEAP